MARPPLHITPRVLSLTEELGRLLGNFEGLQTQAPQPALRRENRIRTVQGSVAIEGNTLSLDQVTALLDGRRVLGSAKEIREVQNAIDAYEQAPRWKAGSQRDLLRAHQKLMDGLASDAGRFRSGNVGVLKGSQVAHVAPPAKQVPRLIHDLLVFVQGDVELPLLLRACVCHYELEFIHPFSDGNGRLGRLWQHVALVEVSSVFAYVPVESLIRERQQAYYEALGISDRAGECTPFLEFSLQTLRDGLAGLLAALRPEAQTKDLRLAVAAEHFGHQWFTRKAYLGLHKLLSTASASRDLRHGLDLEQLEGRGQRARTEYRFRTKRARP